MIEIDSSSIRIVADALEGQRELDEKTYACLEDLSERLEMVKGFGKAFSGIEFSPEVRELQGRKSAVAVV